MAVDGARAKGGPVSRGNSYLIGEKRPEIFTPNRSGHINPNTGPAASPTITVSPSFAFNGVSAGDAAVIEDRVKNVMRDEVRELFRGVFADAGLRFA